MTNVSKVTILQPILDKDGKFKYFKPLEVKEVNETFKTDDLDEIKKHYCSFYNCSDVYLNTLKI